MAENTVAFGSPPVLTLEIKRRLFPDGDNYADRNALAVNVTVAAGRFRGFVETHFRADELARFRDTLQMIRSQLRGDWHHEFLGSGLDFRIKGDGMGHFNMVCVVDDQGGVGNELKFEVRFDQTEIPEILGALDRVMSNFPVRPE